MSISLSWGLRQYFKARAMWDQGACSLVALLHPLRYRGGQRVSQL